MHGAGPEHPPGRYDALISFMERTGQSWRDVMDSPFDLVDEWMTHIAARDEWTAQKRKLDAQRNS